MYYIKTKVCDFMQKLPILCASDSNYISVCLLLVCKERLILLVFTAYTDVYAQQGRYRYGVTALNHSGDKIRVIVVL